MGNGEEKSTPTKSPKSQSAVGERSAIPTAPLYRDWSTSVQGLYGAGVNPSFLASSVAPPAATHPYLWGVAQHPLMAPYGTPVPFPAVYPPGGAYVHPNIALSPVAAAQGTSESEAKSADGNERARKKSKRASGSDSKNAAAAASGSGNDVATQSAESGSEGSSDGSEDDNGKGYCVAAKKGSFDQMLADGAIAQSNGVPNNYRGAAGVAVPATNPNIGMDIWRSSSAGSGASKLHQTPPGVSPADEREMKRQKRKQSNRESARRSRLRKQAECERLQQKVETLTNENRALRDELQRVTEECDKLEAENDTIKEELSGFCGPEMLLSKLGRSSSPSMTGE